MSSSNISLNTVISIAGGTGLVLLAAILAIILRRWLQKKKNAGSRLNQELIPKLIITDMSMFPASVTVVDDEEDLGKIISSYKPMVSSEEQPQAMIIEGPGGVRLNIENGLQEALNKYYRDHGKHNLWFSTDNSTSAFESSAMVTSLDNSSAHSGLLHEGEPEAFSVPESAEKVEPPVDRCSFVVTLPSSCDLISGEQDLGLMGDCQYLEHYWALADDAASDSSHGSYCESAALIHSTLETYKMEENPGIVNSSSRLQTCLRSLPSLRSVGTIDGLDTRILDYIWRITGNHNSVNSFNETVTSISGPAIRISDDTSNV